MGVRNDLDGRVGAVGDVQVAGNGDARQTKVTWAHFANGREQFIVERAAHVVANGQQDLKQVFGVSELHGHGHFG